MLASLLAVLVQTAPGPAAAPTDTTAQALLRESLAVMGGERMASLSSVRWTGMASDELPSVVGWGMPSVGRYREFSELRDLRNLRLRRTSTVVLPMRPAPIAFTEIVTPVAAAQQVADQRFPGSPTQQIEGETSLMWGPERTLLAGLAVPDARLGRQSLAAAAGGIVDAARDRGHRAADRCRHSRRADALERCTGGAGSDRPLNPPAQHEGHRRSSNRPMAGPPPALGLAALLSVLGLIAALQVWTRPGSHPGLPFLAMLHVPHWSLWAALSLAVWAVHARIQPQGVGQLSAVHVPLAFAVITTHAALVACWDMVVASQRFSMAWTTVFNNHLHSSTVTEALGDALILGGVLLVTRRASAAEAAPSPAGPGMPLPLPVRVGDQVLLVEPSEIRYVEAANNYARLFTADRRLPVRQSLTSLEGMLPDRFVRVHRSVLINLDHVARLRSDGRWRKVVVLRCGAELPASAEGWRRLRARLTPPEA